MTPEFKTDRSSMKTRKCMRIALMELLKTKPLSKITVKEITEAANYSRNTFYTHYIDIYDVVEDIADQYAVAFTASSKKLTTERMLNKPKECSQEIMSCIKQSPDIYDFAFLPDHFQFFELFRKKMIESCKKRYYKETEQPIETVAEIIVPGIVRAVIGSVKDWYNSERTEERLTEILFAFAQFIQKGMA